MLIWPSLDNVGGYGYVTVVVIEFRRRVIEDDCGRAKHEVLARA